jgi:hypothetical protein
MPAKLEPEPDRLVQLSFPSDHISFWDNKVSKSGKRPFQVHNEPNVHHWDSMMIFEETTESLFPSDLFI